MAIIPKLIYEFNTLPNKIPADSWQIIGLTDPQIHKKKKFKGLRITKSILEKKTKTLNYSYFLISKLTTNNYNNQDTDLRM